MRISFRMLALLIAVGVLLAACAAEPTAAPTEAPTATPTTSAAPTETEAPTAEPEPTAAPTAAVVTAQDILIPHSLEGMDACESCHGPEGAVPNPPDHAGWSDENCRYCHLPADDPDSGLEPNDLTQEDCLACHGPFEDLAGMGVLAEADDGSEVNPHVYVPHDSETIEACSNCHEPHSLPPNADELTAQPAPGLETCYECHHTRNFMTCTSCHAIVPAH